MNHEKNFVEYWYDDLRGGGGGGSAPIFDLDTRLSSLLASKLSSYKFRRRLIVLLFAHPESPIFRDQLKPKLEYWHFRSGERLDLLCLGYSGKANSFDPELLASSVTWLQSRSGWRYSGETDLVLLNARVSPKSQTLELETQQIVSVALEQAVQESAIRSVPHIMERVFSFVDSYAGDDPAWGFSDQEGKRLASSGLKALLIACLPKALRKDARAAFHFYVREYPQPAA